MTDYANLIQYYEQQVIHDVLPRLFGFHLLYISLHGKEFLTHSSPIAHRLFVSQSGEWVERLTNVRASCFELPFASHSLDVVLLPHIFDKLQNPHELMQEVARVIVPGGHVLLFNFHKFTLWRLLGLNKALSPAGIRKSYLQDILIAEQFTIEQSQDYFYRPCLTNKKRLKQLNLLEKMGPYLWPNAAAAYWILAEKNLPNLKPLINPQSKQQRTKKRLIESINRART